MTVIVKNITISKESELTISVYRVTPISVNWFDMNIL